ncbi:MAG: hypothetical protein R3A45_07270 [Bdellovibrionota bacterium]
MHIALKQLRLFNKSKTPSKKLEYFNALAKYTVNITDQKNRLALNFINKGISILSEIPDAPYYEQYLILSRYAFFQTVHRCNYALSTTIWKKIIEIRIKNGILSDLDNAYSQLMINNFFAGHFDRALNNYKKVQELTLDNKTRFLYNMAFWSSLTYLILGNIDEFKKQIVIARNGRHYDPWFRTIRFYCMAYYHLYKKNYYNAFISFKRLLMYYERIPATPVIADTGLLMTCSKAEHYGHLSENDYNNIRKWINIKRHNQSYNHWSFQIHALTLARFTDKDFGIDPYAVVPADCPNAFLKQKMYVEKIKFLDHKKINDQADQLRTEYIAYRKKLELNIPYEHLQSFRDTPLFPVPT